MQMRMPDRLTFRSTSIPHCAPTPGDDPADLVENAVRHGIDPSEAGGHIEVGARRSGDGGALTLWVQDSGGGIDESRAPGTGLANLRERLLATHGPGASLALHGIDPHGVRAEIRIAKAGT
jgi:LytS/YehU family sensor histidine kinase